MGYEDQVKSLKEDMRKEKERNDDHFNKIDSLCGKFKDMTKANEQITSILTVMNSQEKSSIEILNSIDNKIDKVNITPSANSSLKA